MEEIAKLTFINPKNLRRYLNSLREKGFLTIERKNEYRKTTGGKYKKYYYNLVVITFEQSQRVKRFLKPKHLAF